MKLIVESFKLTSSEEAGEGFKTILYKRGEEEWSEVLVNVDESNSEVLLNRMLELAGNKLTVKHARRESGEYTFINVKAPGASITLGEGSSSIAETMLSPKPKSLIGVRLVKVDSEGKYSVIRWLKPSGESIAYEGSIKIEDPGVQYDLVLLDLEDDVRILLPHELSLPKLRIPERRAKEKPSERKSRKSKKKKSKRTKRKSRRGRSRKKSKKKKGKSKKT
ncbi:MAG: hypothetical protein OWQ48_02280 [Desulfurococcus sp.]|nr:hypothetical protein [Desulfurococcus sp.]